MRAVLFLPWLVAAACGSSGDGRPDEDLKGLVVSADDETKPIDVGRAAKDTGELARAVALSHEKVGTLVGPHVLVGKARIVVREGKTVVESLDNEIAIELDAKGNYHARDSNSKEYGREAFLVDGWMYLRPRFGKYHKRRPADEAEPARVRGDVFGTVAAYLDLLAPGMSVSDGGATDVSGRAARLVKLATADEGKKREETTSQRKWREEAVVKEVSGEIALDANNGAPLRASVRGVVVFQRQGHTFEMTIEAQHELGSFGKVAEVTAPPETETVSDIEQRHELTERESLLQGIAPPSKRAPTPGQGPAQPTAPAEGK